MPQDVTYRDPKVPGLHVKRGRSWHLFYRDPQGRQRRPKIGDVAVLNVTQARAKARTMLAELQLGRDPVQNRVERPTVAALADRYLDEHAAARKRPHSIRCDRSLFNRHILPALGRKAVADVRQADVMALHHAMRATPAQANRMVALLHKAFALAERWDWRPPHSNPAVVDRYRERPRRRKPDVAEALRLFAAMERARVADPWFVGFVELTVLTGCRPSEILQRRRDDVTAEGLLVPLPKEHEPKVVMLNRHARDVVEALPAEPDNPHLIPGRRRGRHLVNYSKPWKRLLADAQISGLQVRDLRRWFASIGVSRGLALEAVGQLLHHTQAQTTKRYAYLLTDAAQEASERVGAVVAGFRPEA